MRFTFTFTIAMTLFFISLFDVSFGRQQGSFFAMPDANARTRGGGSDGGACGVQVQGKWILKDFVRAQINLSRVSDLPGTQMALGPVAQTIGFEVLNGRFGTIDFRSLAPYQEALRKVRLWREDSPEVASLIEGAMTQLNWAATGGVFRPIAFGCRESSDYPLAIYQSELGLMLTLISAPKWNELSQHSQVGLIFKESLRFLQIENQLDLFSGERFTERGELLLSRLVSTLVFSQPRSRHQTLLQVFRRSGSNPSIVTSDQINSLRARVCNAAPAAVHTYLRETGPHNSQVTDAANTVLGLLQNCRSQELEFTSDNIEQSRLLRWVDSVREATHQLTLAHLAVQLSPEVRRRIQAGENLGSIYIRRSELMEQIRLATEPLSRIHALALQSALARPETRASMNSLNAISDGLQECARTMQNDRCSTTGFQNIEIISEAIATGNTNESINRAIQAMQMRFQTGTREIFR